MSSSKAVVYQAVIGEQKKYAVYAYGAPQAQYQIEHYLSRRRASDAERTELALWVAAGRRVAREEEISC